MSVEVTTQAIEVAARALVVYGQDKEPPQFWKTVPLWVEELWQEEDEESQEGLKEFAAEILRAAAPHMRGVSAADLL